MVSIIIKTHVSVIFDEIGLWKACELFKLNKTVGASFYGFVFPNSYLKKNVIQANWGNESGEACMSKRDSTR